GQLLRGDQQRGAVGQLAVVDLGLGRQVAALGRLLARAGALGLGREQEAVAAVLAGDVLPAFRGRGQVGRRVVRALRCGQGQGDSQGADQSQVYNLHRASSERGVGGARRG